MAESPLDVLTHLAALRERCEAAEYTDTGDAWAMIDRLEDALRQATSGSPLDVPLSVDELAAVAPDLDPGLRDTEDGEPWTARRIIERLLAFHDDEPLVLRDAREAERESAEADTLARLTEMATYAVADLADHSFIGTERVPGYCKRCGCAAFIHPVVQRCPHGRSVESRRDNPCPPGLAGCEPTSND